ncbi:MULTISPECIES: hypothetical protein [Spongiibacter]|uniref:DUF6436 domain-containing protein n=1 Tax=Spongiibacter TaxID=630749 RepID=UPI001AFE7230|nr:MULTISPECIES: hypothetical protein [Spongiibacter]MBO6754588.1 hypothetical protein [Spongiibacter sp.]
MAVQLRQLVDVLASVTERRYDKFLIHPAILAPLALVLLGKWQASLESWYVDPDEAPLMGFNDGFSARAQAWLLDEGYAGDQLVLIVDRHCACTAATLKKLTAILEEAERPTSMLKVIDVGLYRTGNGMFDAPAILAEIPSTPTLLTMRASVLTYVGPVTSGNFCTTAVNDVMGVSALSWESEATVFDWLNRGCYCDNPIAEPHSTATGEA